MENVRNLAHLHHKGGAAGGQIVRSADAGKDPVRDTDDCGFRRNKGADLGHEDDQGCLAHIGGLTGHVGASHDGEAVGAGVEVGVIRDKADILQGLLNDGMAAFPDGELTGGVDFGHCVAVAHRDLGQRAEAVQRCNPRRGLLDTRHFGGHRVAHRDEVVIFQSLDPIPCGQKTVLQFLQFRGEVALIGDQGLLADIVFGHIFETGGFRNVNVVTEDTVVADLQLPDTGSLTLLLLQSSDALGTVIAQLAQFVQLLREALADHAALTDGEGGIITDGAVDFLPDISEQVHGGNVPELCAGHVLQQLLQTGQNSHTVGEHTQITAAGAAVHRAAHEPLHVADVFQSAHEFCAADTGFGELLHCIEATADGGNREQRPFHPGAEHSAAHGSTGFVQHPEKTAFFLTAAQGLGEFQTAAGGVVQLHISAAEKDIQPVDMGEVALLRLLEVLQQCSAGADGVAAVLKAGFVHVGKPELLTHTGGTGEILKIVRAEIRHGIQLLPEKGDDGGIPGCSRGQYGLTREKAGQLVSHMLFTVSRESGTAELSGGELAESDAGGIAGEKDGTDIVAALIGKHGTVSDGARSDDADDVALHETLGQGGILQLLTDGDLVSPGDELGDVPLSAVVRHTAHGGALLRVLNIAVAGGERQIQLPGGGDGIIVEHLIEIAEAEEEQTVIVLLLDLLVLPLHRREFSHGFPLPFRRVPRCCRQ